MVNTHYRGFPVTFDYEMDPEIVDNPIYKQGFTQRISGNPKCCNEYAPERFLGYQPEK